VPIPPRWLADQGGRITGLHRAEPKARHGRRELRICWALAEPGVLRWLGSTGEHRTPWPHVRQICRLERHRVRRRRGQPAEPASIEVRYLITSLPPERADAAALLGYQRGHWGIENRLHWVRDVTFDEDRCTVRSGTAPQALTACRTLALALLRRRRVTNIAAALRTHASRPATAISLVTSSHLRLVK
jgi:Transposase DDE domain